jgi:PAS domain S-box-containing protein
VSLKRLLFGLPSLLNSSLSARRRRPQAILHDSEEHYRLLVEGSADYAIFLLDPSGRIASWNAGAERLLGYRETEAIGLCLSTFFTPEDIAAGRPEEELALANNTGRAASEGWRIRKDGNRFYAHGSLRAIRDGAKLRAYAKIMHDVTGRYRAEQQLTVQYTISRVLAESATTEQAVPAVVETICSMLGWDYGAAWEADDKANLLRCLATWHSPVVGPQSTDMRRELVLERGVGLPGRVWLSGDPVWVADVAQDVTLAHAAGAITEGLRAAVAFPLRLGNDTLGVFEFFSRKVRNPDRDLLTLMSAVGNQVSQFIERKRAEAALQESAARTRAIVDAAVDGIITIDEQGIIDSTNPAAERIFGYSRDELIGHNVRMLMPLPHRERHDGYLANYLHTGERRVLGVGREVVGQRKDGTTFPIDLSLSEIVLNRRRLFTGIVRDISERKQADNQRAAAFERERQAREEAEKANRAKEEFLAVISHELRTPLTPILTWSRLLRSGKLDQPATERAIEAIERAARAQAQLIEDLLDVSRITSGKLRLDVRPIELQPVVEAAIESVRPGAEAKGMQLELVLDRNAGVVSGDPERLQQVVWNLLSNAIKFTPRGGRIQVCLQRVDSHVEIAVSDTGQGIDPEFLPHVFERFRQADSSSTRTHGGLGLGLAIVRHLVELHGGRVRAQSPGEGQGATFVVELPLAILHQPLAPDRIHPRAGEGVPFDGKPNLRGVRILVVDDEPDTLDTLRAVLEQAGAEVRSAGSARDALVTLDQWRADVLVCDIGMPQEDGYSLIRKVRALAPERGGYMPAVALTAYARVEDRLKVLSSGFQMHVPKPVEPAELVAIMATMKEWGGRSSEGTEHEA